MHAWLSDPFHSHVHSPPRLLMNGMEELEAAPEAVRYLVHPSAVYRWGRRDRTGEVACLKSQPVTAPVCRSKPAFLDPGRRTPCFLRWPHFLSDRCQMACPWSLLSQ